MCQGLEVGRKRTHKKKNVFRCDKNSEVKGKSSQDEAGDTEIEYIDLDYFQINNYKCLIPEHTIYQELKTQKNFFSW